MNLEAVIANLNSIGFYSVVLPFLLVYVIVFAILEKSEIFSKKDNADESQTKNVNAIIAFVFGLFVVASVNTVILIQNIITSIIVFIILILVILILLGFVFGEKYKELLENKFIKWSLFTIIIVVVLAIFLQIVGFWNYLLNLSFLNSSNIMTVLVIIGIVLVIYLVSKGGNSNNEKNKDK